MERFKGAPVLPAGRVLQHAGIRCSEFQGHWPVRWEYSQGVGAWVWRGKVHCLSSGDRAVPAGYCLLRQLCRSKGRDERKQEKLR